MRLWISFKPCVLTGFFWHRSARACGVLLCYRQVETDMPVPQQTSADTCLYCWALGAQGFNFPRGLQSHDGGGGQLPSSGNDIWCPTRPALMTLAGSGEADGLLTACIGGRPGVLWTFMGMGGASPCFSCGVWREWSCII